MRPHDLALIKTLSGSQAYFNSGDNVTFNIYVENQGWVASTGVVITDYIPTGLTLDDTDWTDNNDGTASYDIGALGTGMNTTIPITFTVGSVSAATTLTNRAEISEDTPINTSGTPIL